jgi:hypothetical protein
MNPHGFDVFFKLFEIAVAVFLGSIGACAITAITAIAYKSEGLKPQSKLLLKTFGIYFVIISIVLYLLLVYV